MNQQSTFVHEENAAHRAGNNRFALAERFQCNETEALTQELFYEQLTLHLI